MTVKIRLQQDPKRGNWIASAILQNGKKVSSDGRDMGEAVKNLSKVVEQNGETLGSFSIDLH